MNNNSIKSFVAALWVGLACLGLTTSSMGTTRTWSGLGGNTTFSTPGNWVGSVAPVAGDDVIFTGTSHQTCNFTAAISLNSITFDSAAGSFTITGSILTVTSQTTGIVNNSGVNQSFANGFTQNAVKLFVNTGTGGVITFSGELGTSSANFSNGMTVSGSGTMKVTFAGGGDNIGVVTINSGATQELKDYTDFGDNLTTESLTLNGGIIQVDGAYSSGYTNHFLETAVTLGTGGGTFNVPTGQSLVWISTGYLTPSHIVIAGGASSPLTIAGGGTLTMASPQPNTYTGGTVVAGKLTVSAINNYGVACVNNLGTGPVTVNSGGLLTLATGVFPSAQNLILNTGTPVVNLTGVNTASQLSFDGGATFQASGVWGSPASGAAHQDSRFTGTGTLFVSTGPSAYWDALGTDASSQSSANGGGTGGWDSSTSDWWSGGGSDAMWPTGEGAIFAGTAGTVTLNDSLNAAGLTFNTAGYTVNEGSGSPILTLAGEPVISVSSGISAVNCTLAGTTGLTVSGSGTLSLGGVDTYTGGTTVSAGSSLIIASPGVLGNGTYADNITNNGYFTYNSSVAQTLSGAISGAGSNTIGTGSTLTIGGAGTFGNTGRITNNGSFIFNSTASSAIPGIISGEGSLTESGSGTLTLSGVNTYTNTTTIGTGSTLTIVGAGKLASGAYAGNMTNAGTFTYNSSAAQSLSGVISGAGALNQNGSGTLTLKAANTYSGGTSVNSGTLDITTGSIQGTATLNGGILELDNNTALASSDTINVIASVNGELDLTYPANTPLYIATLESSGTPQSAGTYGAVGSSATYTFPQLTGTGILVVGATPTTTTITGPTSVTYGSSPTYTATVTGGTPAGTVQFYVDGVAIGSAVNVVSGTAQQTITAQSQTSPAFDVCTGSPAGTHQISAVFTPSYPPTLNCAPSTSANYPVTITALASITVVGSRAYDGATDANVSILTMSGGTLFGDSVTLANGSGIVASAGVSATPQSITPGTLALGGAQSCDYTILSGLLTITNSYPKLTNTASIVGSGPSATLQVCWQTIPGVIYHVYTNANLMNGQTSLAPSWVEDTATTPPSPITGDGGIDCVTMPCAAPLTNNFVLIQQAEY